MFLKNRNIISKIKKSKVTDYAALISRINEVYVFFNKISLFRYSDILLKNTLTSFITVCFAAITRVTVPAWFM